MEPRSLFAGNSNITSKPMSFKALSHWRILLYTSGGLGGRLAVLLFLAFLVGLIEHCVPSHVLAAGHVI